MMYFLIFIVFAIKDVGVQQELELGAFNSFDECISEGKRLKESIQWNNKYFSYVCAMKG